MIRLKTYFLFLSLILLACCKKDADDEIPVVSYFTLNGSFSTATANAGDVIGCDITVQDETQLKQLRITIRDSLGNASFNVYELYFIEEISGTAFVELYSITIDSTATAGLYVIEAEAIDVEGNVSEKVRRELTLTHADQPVINVSAPTFLSPHPVGVGDTIHLEGNASTPTYDLINVSFDISNGEEYESNFDLPAPNFFMDFDTLASSNNYIIVPNTAGNYIFSMMASDSYGHITRQEVALQVN